ncbi:hypothetical protein TI04_01835 [Achromatium sp. WMS2]|nr:hypothetical protein TI04_01835 [Achromatium sp. WMS2]
MSDQNDAFVRNLSVVQERRQQFAEYIEQINAIINQANNTISSGKLPLDREIQDLQIARDSLIQARFKLMVLGDMKRGKSTLLNAILGKDILPSDVNPCTALLTIIKYGPQEQIRVVFKDGRTQNMAFSEFKKRYTIPPEEAKRIEETKQDAFPNIKYAELEYPLEILKNGVEIIDSPGLNDTLDRNNLTLGYINNCHAIFFVLSATQPCTMEERRYLDNYLKERGLTIFFLINRWDEISSSVFDPEDQDEVKQAEDKQRSVFKNNIGKYCVVDGVDIYRERVFETSSIKAMRARMKGRPMHGSGVDEFIAALERFLIRDRAVAEFQNVRSLLRGTHRRLREIINQRIPMLGASVAQLRTRIDSVRPAFDKLRKIRDDFKRDIDNARSSSSKELSNTAYDFFSRLDVTFDIDFAPYAPQMGFFQFLSQGKRKEFENKMNESFSKYLNDKMAQWSLTAEKDLRGYGDRLALKAAEYGIAYQDITTSIDHTVSGVTVNADQTNVEGETVQTTAGWTRFAVGATSFLLGDFVGAAGAATGTFNWRMLLVSLGGTLAVNLLLSLALGVVLGPAGIALVMGGMGAGQAEGLRREFIKKLREEIKKALPAKAREISSVIADKVSHLYDGYEHEVLSRIDKDIKDRQTELSNLVTQKEKGEINQEAERDRLTKMEDKVHDILQTVETAFDKIATAQRR